MQVSKVSQSAVSVRQETPDDLQAIRRVNTDAFGRLTTQVNMVVLMGKVSWCRPLCHFGIT
jgi:hypothetical protein